MVAVRAEGMIKLFLLILVIVSQTRRCLATGQTEMTIRRDIIESICGFTLYDLISAYIRYCENDGFKFCSEYMHTPHLVKTVVAYALPLWHPCGVNDPYRLN